jgi:pimeloyl-ACP methyl ester carboxylesterase
MYGRQAHAAAIVPAARVPGRQDRWLDADGPLHYVEYDGPSSTTYVLIHGLGGSHLNWMRVASGLAAHGRVVVPDLPGFGLSPLSGRRSAMHLGRRVVARLVRETASGRTVVAGNSMGGGHAMLLAAFEPDIVDALVLTGSVFPWAPAGLPSPLVIGAFALYRTPWIGEALVRERLRRLDPETVVRLGFRLTTADPSAIPADVVRAHVDLVRDRRTDVDAAPAFVEAARSILWLGARPALSTRVMDAVRCPVLVIHGTRDRLVPLAYARSAVDRRPSWRFRFLPRVGHAPQLEAPDRWLAAVGDALGLDAPAQAPAAFARSARASSMASASSSTSGTASRSAVSPNAIVPDRDVHAIDSEDLGPSGSAG